MQYTDETPTRHEIEERAYYIYLSHGAHQGHSVEDWLAAEQLKREHASHSRGKSALATPHLGVS